MNDLISRQAAIDVLSVSKELLSRVLDDMDVVGTDREKYSWGLGLIESNIEDINDLPSAQPEPQWIPCSEKAHPDLPVRVQVQMTNGWIITAYYQDGEWLSVPNCEDAIHDEWIEAWRYLPEPWRGDTE